MPNIQFEGQSIVCEQGANLRRVLLDAGLPLYNGPMKVTNCHGFGTCGTCAVKLEGAASPPAARERLRLDLPPHKRGIAKGLRLACQCQVEGDVTVTKPNGWWGQKVNT
ncbi:MAG: 2Fe-2S iron-sulfur cluster-binding protein [Planctomycetota bacterium]